MTAPFNTFKIEKKAGEYKSFAGLNDDYPLKGVTYPVDYGDITGYTGQDGANLIYLLARMVRLRGTSECFV